MKQQKDDAAGGSPTAPVTGNHDSPRPDCQYSLTDSVRVTSYSKVIQVGDKSRNRTSSFRVRGLSGPTLEETARDTFFLGGLWACSVRRWVVGSALL
jgi:hypothetical protein